MFEHWNFEPALIDALREVPNPSTQNVYAKVLGVIAHAANIKGIFTEEVMMEAGRSIEQFGLNKTAFEEAVSKVKSTL